MWVRKRHTLTAFFTSLSASTVPVVVRSFVVSTKSMNKALLLKQMSSSTSTHSIPPLIDVDCNLIHRDLRPLFQDTVNNDLPSPFQILQQDAVEKVNIVAILSPSSTVQEAKAILDLLPADVKLPSIRTTVGIHPYHVNDNGPSLEQQIESCTEILSSYASYVAAIGECGLDASEGFPPIEDQIPWFQAQIQLAEKFQKPLFVHERFAFQPTMELLAHCTVPVIIHCFTGTPEECQAYIDRGYYISLSGYICKDTDEASITRNCLHHHLPLDRLMIETDAPYMGFPGCRDLYLEKHSEVLTELNSKKRKRLTNTFYPNVPSSLSLVLDRIVETLQEKNLSITRDQVAWQTTKNANHFFQFKINGLE